MRLIKGERVNFVATENRDSASIASMSRLGAIALRNPQLAPLVPRLGTRDAADGNWLETRKEHGLLALCFRLVNKIRAVPTA